MPISHDALKALLVDAFPNSSVECTDLAGDNDHWQVAICSAAFASQSRIMQHKMVQHAVAGHDIHALSIKTSIPQ